MTQLQMIDKTKSIAQNDKNISAVFMYGSFTKNEGDKYSDIEFYIFLKDKENFSAENWVSQIHPLALYFTNEYGSEVAIFENMIRGEFRSEERRVGKECRSRRSPEHEKKNLAGGPLLGTRGRKWAATSSGPGLARGSAAGAGGPLRGSLHVEHPEHRGSAELRGSVHRTAP